MTWQEAARGIEPWPGAKLEGGAVIAWVQDGLVGVAPDSRRDSVTMAWRWDTFPIDLADPDTRVAFDRRLALRLGAPPEWVDEALCVTVHNGRLFVEAGLTPEEEYVDYAFRWAEEVRVDTDDILLARALAWRSVP